jgi:hypothetical protein
MNENNIQLFLTTGAIYNGYVLSYCGNYMILHSKEIAGETLVTTQKTFEMGGVEKVVSTFPLERRTDIPKELLTEEKKVENNG